MQKDPVTKGILYIVATPIGNIRDMTQRSMEILRDADIIATEDTRRAMVLLNYFGIKNTLVSNHKYNEHGKSGYFINELLSGKSVAVITDAGTPCISDPGNELIKAAIQNDIEVQGIPGSCAVTTALSISGFDLTSFFFYGFFPREASDRKKLFQNIKKSPLTRVYAFYESPKRIMSAVEFLIENAILCRVCLCNDLTKRHEKTFRGSPDEIRQQLLEKGNYEKGEFVLILEFEKEYFDIRPEHTITPEALLVDTMIGEKCSPKEAIRILLNDPDQTFTRNELYKASLNLKELI